MKTRPGYSAHGVAPWLSDAVAPIPVEPIGVVRCAAREPLAVPSEGLPSTVLIRPDLVPALEGIGPGDFLYVVTWFHWADRSVLIASPDALNRRGSFALRSSDRPSPIGLTLSRVVAISGPRIDFEWLDFIDGTPVLDLKRYNLRWECALAAPREDRRYIEQQLPAETLAAVLLRPMVNVHGERCPELVQFAQAAAHLTQQHDLWLGNPRCHWHVEGSRHLVDAVMAISGATIGNGRLTAVIETAPLETLIALESASVSVSVRPDSWAILKRGTP